VVTNLTNPDAWKDALGNPAMYVAAFVVLNLIVFTETGLLFGFFLPGDSLLVTAGIVAHTVGWPIVPLVLTLCVSAIIGDSVGYWIGLKAGPAIFNRPSSRFFKRDHLLAAKAFYERHGGKTIIIARFMPFIRTFAPVVAGAARMEYKRFLMFNIVGGISWICSMLLFGYTLHLWANAVLRPIFGEKFQMEKNIDILAAIIIFLSVAPIMWKGARHWLAKRRAPKLTANT
jgi:membrane-associated protein